MNTNPNLIADLDERLSKLPYGPGMAAVDVFDTFDIVRQWFQAHGHPYDLDKATRIVELLVIRRGMREVHDPMLRP